MIGFLFSFGFSFLKIKINIKILSLTLALIFILSLTACSKAPDSPVWENATYTEDTAFGNGSKTIVVEVKADENSVRFTIKTDKTTVGEALMEHNLISGEQGVYGLYVKAVNGITADYDTDKSYWAFYINGEYAMTGVDTTNINESDAYRLEYVKE